jgi:hypothetical protein
MSLPASPLLEPRERRDHWRIRRRVLFATIGFCMLTVLHAITLGEDTRVAETAITMAFMTMVACVGSYVFGAAWEDITVATKLIPQSRRET